MREYKYPAGYTPMTLDEYAAIYMRWRETGKMVDQSWVETIERAFLDRLPKSGAEAVAWQNVNDPYIFTKNKTWFDEAPQSWRPLYAHPPTDTAKPSPELMAIKMLVAAGFVTEAKANEALNIAHGFSKEPLSPAHDTAEREMLVRRIDGEWLSEIIPDDLESLLRKIRSHLVGGGE